MTITDDFISAFLVEAAQHRDLKVGLHLSTGARLFGWVESVEGGVATIETDGFVIHVRVPHIITAHYA